MTEEIKEEKKQEAEKKTPAKKKNKVVVNKTKHFFKVGTLEIKAGGEKELSDYESKNPKLLKIINRQLELGLMEIK